MKETKQTIQKTVSVDVDFSIDTNDIFNWITFCNNIDELKYINRYIQRKIRSLKEPDNDDFRSRA